MARHAGKTTWTQDIIANFDHNFWNGMGDHKVKAARLWGHVWKKTERGIIWHIYHTILALLLAGVLIVEVIELWIK